MEDAKPRLPVRFAWPKMAEHRIAAANGFDARATRVKLDRASRLVEPATDDNPEVRVVGVGRRLRNQDQFRSRAGREFEAFCLVVQAAFGTGKGLVCLMVGHAALGSA